VEVGTFIFFLTIWVTTEHRCRAYERGFSRYIGPGPESQEGTRESLKGHTAFVVDNMGYYWTQGSVTIIIRNDPNPVLLYLVYWYILGFGSLCVMIVTGHCATG